jgi:hypothetical protein
MKYNIGDKVLMKSILEFETYSELARAYLTKHKNIFTIRSISISMTRDTFNMEETKSLIWYDNQIEKVEHETYEPINDRFEILDL